MHKRVEQAFMPAVDDCDGLSASAAAVKGFRIPVKLMLGFSPCAGLCWEGVRVWTPHYCMQAIESGGSAAGTGAVGGGAQSAAQGEWSL